MSRTKSFLKAFTLIVIFFLCGCGSAWFVTYHQTYSGSPRNLLDVAIVIASDHITMSKVDNVKIPFPYAGLVELLPGEHTLGVMYRSSSLYSTGNFDLKFKAQAGRVYEIFPVLHTHDKGWYVDVFDITDGLNLSEKKVLAQTIDTVLAKNRTLNMSVSMLGKKPKDGFIANLPGFGEKMEAQIIGMKGKQVKVKYKFDRYKPRMRVKGSDGKDYHLQISQKDGSVEKVFGIMVRVGDIIQKYVAFQPIDSDIAYVHNGPRSQITRKYKEMSNGKYKLIERFYYSASDGELVKHVKY